MKKRMKYIAVSLLLMSPFLIGGIDLVHNESVLTIANHWDVASNKVTKSPSISIDVGTLEGGYSGIITAKNLREKTICYYQVCQDGIWMDVETYSAKACKRSSAVYGSGLAKPIAKLSN